MSRDEEVEQSWAMHEAAMLAPVTGQRPTVPPAWVLAQKGVDLETARRKAAKEAAAFHTGLLVSDLRRAQNKVRSNNRRDHRPRKR